jgi:3'-5' exoribonuclease
MKAPYVGTLVPNEVVTAQFLVISKEIRQKKTGEPYLSLHLADRTGEIEARMWDNVPEIMNTFDRDDFVKVKGLLQIYQNRSQFTVHRLRRLEDHEVTLGDFFPCSERDPEEMFSELQGIIATLRDPYLRQLLEAVFADTRLAELYKIAPAAKTIHHACRSGLLEHVLSLCTLARLVSSHYKDVDLDLLLAGVILHDIGKVEELSYTRSFGYSAQGQLLGHIIIALRMVGAKIDEISSFPPKLRTLLEHMIISHHGELEFGSPKVPIFQEALLLHHIDNLDSKMDALRSAYKRDRLLEGEFTGWISSLERVLLRKDRYLSEAKPVPPAPVMAVEAVETAPLPPLPTPEQRPVQPEPKPENRPVPVTLFGEKLQAVLQSKK